MRFGILPFELYRSNNIVQNMKNYFQPKVSYMRSSLIIKDLKIVFYENPTKYEDLYNKWESIKIHNENLYQFIKLATKIDSMYCTND